jgi:hypothetical protein
LEKEQKPEFICQECEKDLDPENDYHKKFYLCDVDCGLRLVGMSWNDFI